LGADARRHVLLAAAPRHRVDHPPHPRARRPGVAHVQRDGTPALVADPQELLDSVPELVLVVDEAGIIRDGNATVTTVLGYTRDTSVDNPPPTASPPAA